MKPIDIKKVKESKKVLTVMENTKRVIQQSDDDEWKAELQQFFKDCYDRYAELKAEEEHGVSNVTPITKDFYKFLHAYEQALTEINGRTTRATYLRRALRNNQTKYKDEQEAVIQTLEGLVIKEGGTKGYHFLIENGLNELTAEYLVLQHKDLFSEDALLSSEERNVFKIMGSNSSFSERYEA